MATKMLREATLYLINETSVLNKIDHIARVRFSLAVVAKYIHQMYGRTQKSLPDPTTRRLIDEAAKLCDECTSPWPR